MKPAEYRQMLVDALAKPDTHEGAPVLTLVGKGGLGARGAVVGYDNYGAAIRLYDKDDVRKMLAKFDAASSSVGAREGAQR